MATSSSSCQPCTCQVPEYVDLTEAYSAKHSSNGSAKFGCIVKQLNRNLQQLGWSPISIDLSRITESSPFIQQQKFWSNPKPAILQFFDGEKSFPNATYYTSESGGEGIEPKQSWEVRRCKRYSGDHRADTSILDEITISMHSVISTVNWILGLPPLLLQEDPSNCNSYGCTCSGDNEGPCNVDLLRVFHYEVVPDPGEQEMFGSSAHTDWGTWTVVWQDNVGGLQTYCQSCQLWQDVAAFDQEERLLRFIIHVGDSTSLALAKSRQLSSKPTSPKIATHLFPSPQHRVLSPRTESRASLVYFVYPSPGQSLESLATGLTPWMRQRQGDENNNVDIPFESYYLLWDQSEGSRNANMKRGPKEVFKAIYHKPMQQVFAEKWQQVQRTGY